MSRTYRQQTTRNLSWHPIFTVTDPWAAGTGGQPAPGESILAGIGDRLIYALPTLNVGSGGAISFDTASFLSAPSGFQVIFRATRPPQANASWSGIHVNPALTERIAAIRHHLSLTITDLGKVLRVERPTVYAWIAEASKPHDQNLIRISRIYDLARTWRSLSTKPLGELLRQPVKGVSMLEMLTNEDLAETRIRETLKRFASSPQVAPARIGKGRLTDAVRKHKFTPLSEERSQASFDEETSF
jgi:transcriptional regulator with XRE-family HTH domain